MQKKKSSVNKNVFSSKHKLYYITKQKKLKYSNEIQMSMEGQKTYSNMINKISQIYIKCALKKNSKMNGKKMVNSIRHTFMCNLQQQMSIYHTKD